MLGLVILVSVMLFSVCSDGLCDFYVCLLVFMSSTFMWGMRLLILVRWWPGAS